MLTVGFLEIVGTLSALLIALGWSVVDGRLPGLDPPPRPRPDRPELRCLSARTIATLITGSMVVYFIQPTISTVLIGCAFLDSIPIGRPLAERLADDIVPLDDATKAHPLVRQFFVRLSLLWSLTSLVNAGVTIWLLMTQSTTTFMVVKSAMGPAFGLVTIATAFCWFRHAAARSHVRVHRARSGESVGLVAAPIG